MMQSMRPIDLHVHTNISDGTLTPEEMVQLAYRKGLAAVAITDHDSVAGVQRAMEEGKRLGIRVVPGLEMSTNVEGCDVHLIALFVDIENKELTAKLAETLDDRNRRNYRSVEQLMAAGFDISHEELAAYGDDKVLTRGNIAEILVNKGYAKDVKEAMNLYMRKGKVGYARRIVPGPEECIRLLHGAGALVFVAHLHQIDAANPEHSIQICQAILDMGADGLETRYCEFDEKWQQIAEQIAGKNGCLRSGGSDFHGSLKKNLELGDGYGNLHVPEDYLTEMERFRMQ